MDSEATPRPALIDPESIAFASVDDAASERLAESLGWTPPLRVRLETFEEEHVFGSPVPAAAPQLIVTQQVLDDVLLWGSAAIEQGPFPANSAFRTEVHQYSSRGGMLRFWRGLEAADRQRHRRTGRGRRAGAEARHRRRRDGISPRREGSHSWWVLGPSSA